MRRFSLILALACLIASSGMAQAMELRIFNPNDTAVEPVLELTSSSSGSRGLATRGGTSQVQLGSIPAKGSKTVNTNELGGVSPAVVGGVVAGAAVIAVVAVAASADDDDVENSENTYTYKSAYPLTSGGQSTLAVPQVVKNLNGQSTSLSVVNVGDAPADVTVTYFDQNGVTQQQTTVNAEPNVPAWMRADDNGLPNGFSGTAVVTSDQPLVGAKYNENIYENTNFAPAPQNAAPMQGGVYDAWLPEVQNMNNGAHTQIVQTNMGSEDAASSGVVFSDTAGTTAGIQSYSSDPIPSNSQCPFDPSWVEGLASGTWYSVQVFNTGQYYSMPQAVEAQTTYANDSTTYCPVPGDTLVYVPGVQTTQQGETALTVQNITSSQANLTLNFYNSQGTEVMGTMTTSLDPWGSAKYDVDNFVGKNFQGAAAISSDQPLVAVTNYNGSDGAYAYSGLGGTQGGSRSASNTAYAPFVLINPSYTGWWWEGEDYPGTGISIENQGEQVYLAWYGYGDTGLPEWYSALLASNGVDYEGDLYRYTGWPLAENDPSAGYTAELMGPMTLSFTDSSHGALFFTIGETQYTKNLTRYWSGSTDPRRLNGWWYDPNYGGMGVFLEVRDGRLFASWYHYRDDQSPRWWISIDDFANGSTGYSSPWLEFSSGQTLTGAFQDSTYEGEQGDVTLNFADETHATMTWNGNIYSLQRFIFPGNGR